VSEHHNYLSEIFAARLMFGESVVATEACRVYAAARPENELAPSSSFFAALGRSALANRDTSDSNS
jgi:hypothetical protein